MTKGGAYTRAIGLLASGAGGKSTRYWGASALGTTKFKKTSFGKSVKIKTKIKGGYLEEDLGSWKDIEKNLTALSQKASAVKVGLFQEDSGSHLVAYAAKNELGWNKIPQRSYIGKTFDVHYKAIRERFQRAAGGLLDGTMQPEAFFIYEGTMLKNQIQDFIFGNYWLRNKPNRPTTIRKKGFNHPLIDTGDLVNALTFKLVKEGLKEE